MKTITKFKLGGALSAVIMASTVLANCDNGTAQVNTTPKPVSNLTAQAGENKVYLSWSLEADANRAEIVVSYDHDNNPATPDKTENLTKDTQAYAAKNLAGGKAVEFKVAAKGADGKTSKPATKSATAAKNADEIATDRKAEFDAWVDKSGRTQQEVNPDGPVEPMSEGFKQQLKGIHPNNNDQFPGYTKDYFYDNTPEDAQKDLKKVPNKAADDRIFAKVQPKNPNQSTAQYLASINKRNLQIVKNSRICTV